MSHIRRSFLDGIAGAAGLGYLTAAAQTKDRLKSLLVAALKEGLSTINMGALVKDPYDTSTTRWRTSNSRFAPSGNWWARRKSIISWAQWKKN